MAVTAEPRFVQESSDQRERVLMPEGVATRLWPTSPPLWKLRAATSPAAAWHHSGMAATIASPRQITQNRVGQSGVIQFTMWPGTR